MWFSMDAKIKDSSLGLQRQSGLMEVSSKHGFELCCFISLQCMHDNDCGGYV
jgi:hypothetical protein